MYIIEAALEYLISLLVTGAFLATITKELGISDSLTAVLSAITALGCLFQLASVSFRKNSVKRMVVILSVANQLLFGLLYLIPLFDISKTVKTVIFVCFVVFAYMVYNFAHPKKIAWLMSLVDDDKRGRFTANKEIVSLISGMVFSYLMGLLIDFFKAKNDLKTAFIISAATIFLLMVGHTLTLLFSVEKTSDSVNTVMAEKSIRARFASVLKDSNIRKVTAVYVLYQIATYSALSFYGTFVVNDLGMELALVSLITIVGSLARITVSRFWGKYADKYSFASLIEKCFIIFALSLLCMSFASARIGIVMYTLYHILHGIAMGGINSSLTNMIFDYAPREKRADALVVSQSTAGVIGFLMTIVMSLVFERLQQRVAGSGIFAQQILSLFSVAIVIIAIIFVRIAIIRPERERKKYIEEHKSELENVLNS